MKFSEKLPEMQSYKMHCLEVFQNGSVIYKKMSCIEKSDLVFAIFCLF